MLHPRLIACLLLAVLAACTPPPADEGEGEAGEGEGEASEGEGETAEGEGEGESFTTMTIAADGVAYRTFADTDCDVVEGRAGVGHRALLRFTATVSNAGRRTLQLPSAPGRCGAVDVAAGVFVARLRGPDGEIVVERELEAPGALAIAVGASETFGFSSSSILDVSEVPPGDYVLEVAAGDALGDVAVATTNVVLVTGLACPSTASVCDGVCCPAGVACDLDDGGCQLPDLFVDEAALFDTAEVQEAHFSGESCAILEGCVDAPGDRRLLRFSTTTPNEGNADLVMGRPVERPELFTFSDCHGHFHFDQYADYRLLADDGSVVARGHKQAFCLIDLERRDDDARNTGQFFCSRDGSRPQGISQGWADTYGKHLDCQWVDITGVPAGTYTLEVHVNPQHIFDELDLMNNIARVPVVVPEDPNACVPNPQGEVCNNGEDDDCNDLVDDGCAPVEGADSCDNGFTLDGNGLVLGTIDGADTSSSSPSCGGEGGEFVVHFNVASDGIVYLSTYGSSIDTTLSIYRDISCTPEQELLCADDGCVDDNGNGGAHLLQTMTGGAYTAVIKAKHAGEGGNVQFKVQHAGCADARVLGDENAAVDVTGDLAVGRSRDNTAPSCLEGCDAGGRDELWYFATCPGAHDVDVTTCGAEPASDGTHFDTMLELRADSCLGRPVLGSCNDDADEGRVRCSASQAELRSPAGAGDGLWFVLVDGCGVQATPPNGNGEYELHLTVQPAENP
jgi:hypothetical protein